MDRTGILMVTALLGGIGCGASVAPPRAALVETRAAERAAAEIGAESHPQAKLHLQLAREQTEAAQRLMEDGENARAADALMRAKADAELAVALAHETRAKTQGREAVEKAMNLGTTGGAR